jgi:hypothetical protein
MKKEWVEEIFPDVYIIGHGGSYTQKAGWTYNTGAQAILIDKDDRTYLIFTNGTDYGSWVGDRYILTAVGRERVVNWEGNSYDLLEWLEKSEKAFKTS